MRIAFLPTSHRAGSDQYRWVYDSRHCLGLRSHTWSLDVAEPSASSAFLNFESGGLIELIGPGVNHGMVDVVHSGP